MGSQGTLLHPFLPTGSFVGRVSAFKYSSDAELPNAVPDLIFTVDVGLFDR